MQGDGRREPVDGIDFRHTHLVKQSAARTENRFQISPLRFCVQRAERERGFPEPETPVKTTEGVAGDLDVYVLEVVFASSLYVDKADFWGLLRVCSLR